MVYPILSTHLDLGKHSVSSKTKIVPAQIKSMQGMAIEKESIHGGQPTVGSYGHADPTLITVKGKHGHKIWINRTANNTFWSDDPKNDYFSPQIDCGIRRGSYQFPTIDSWNAAANNNPSVRNDYIPTYYDITGNKIGGISYITGITPLRMWFHNPHDTKTATYATPRIVEDTDINSIGKRASQHENFRQKIRTGVLFNDANHFHNEIARWAEFLESKGIKPIEQPFHGLGIERSNEFIAAYYPKQHYLVANFDFNNIARDLMKNYGLTESEAVEAAERNIILHELAHAYGINGDRRGEKLQGELAAEFYSQLAQEAGGKWARIYVALAQYRKDYAKDFSFSNWLIREAAKGPEFRYSDLTYHKFWHAGIALGYKGKKLEAYIKSRMKDTYGDLLEDDDSDTPERNLKSFRRSSLEEIAENSESVERIPCNYQNIEGRVIYLSERTKPKSTAKAEESKEREAEPETYEGKVVNIAEYRRSREAKADAKGKEAESNKAEKADAQDAGEAPAEAAQAEAA